MASTQLHAHSHHGLGQAGRGRNWFDHVIKRIALWQAVARERRHLQSLDAHMLKDLGLTRVDVMRETERPFWDISPLDVRSR